MIPQAFPLLGAGLPYFWTLLAGPVQRHLASLKAPLRAAARIRPALTRMVHDWSTAYIAGGHLGG